MSVINARAVAVSRELNTLYAGLDFLSLNVKKSYLYDDEEAFEQLISMIRTVRHQTMIAREDLRQMLAEAVPEKEVDELPDPEIS